MERECRSDSCFSGNPLSIYTVSIQGSAEEERRSQLDIDDDDRAGGEH